VKYTTSLKRKHEEDINDIERHGWDGQKVDRNRSLQMIVKKRLPRLGRRTARTRSRDQIGPGTERGTRGSGNRHQHRQHTVTLAQLGRRVTVESVGPFG
jgi:plasmid stabilization system protein ParE